ncbi:uracil-DNA glycosylase [Candidatus Nitrosotenuis sp. DW1]|uniref:uracil-DNA glycosylase n=1 Tax=Candidatus Nitrosotenuis sp. DW1 TaxID=2259672 RepID=UPI0015CBB648|nr:uracil-DNA glycosylase [Candidatus Nitrosotenuis sp. DW1]QLH09774.1 uracil-DNA glycosylase [Candidatus Nitrosotenuis sp. DW1]
MTNILISKLNNQIIQCKKCPRLSAYIKTISINKVKRHAHEKYWGRPLSGFGDSEAELLIIGLAPAAHGGNRTGRMFTGDNSGDWVAKVLHNNGFATKPTSHKIDDGFDLINAYITAAVKCAPPQNKPSKEEINICSYYLREELLLLKNVKVIVCLGKISFDTLKRMLGIKHQKFFHGNKFSYDDKTILCSYHPSRQNTQTGRLSWDQWNEIFLEAKAMLSN